MHNDRPCTYSLLSATLLALALAACNPAPSNGRIVFISTYNETEIVNYPDHANIFSMHPDGSDLIQLTDGYLAYPDNPGPKSLAPKVLACSPDDTRIIFSSGFNMLYLIDVRDYSEDLPGVTPIGFGAIRDWSPDGRYIYTTTDHDFNVYWLEISENAEELNNSEKQLFVQNRMYYGFIWSPDGATIAFVDDENPSANLDIYLADADGSNIINLTNTPNSPESSPAWSPDGQKIAFVTDRDGNAEIYVMDRDGSNLINLTQSPESDERSPAWSPDGKLIAFVTDRDYPPPPPQENPPQELKKTQIYVMNADGSNQHNVSNNLAANISPKWCDIPQMPQENRTPIGVLAFLVITLGVIALAIVYKRLRPSPS